MLASEYGSENGGGGWSKREKGLTFATAFLVLIIFGLTVTLVILVLLDYTNPTTSILTSTPATTSTVLQTTTPKYSPGWLQASKHFLNSIDPSVHPCDNFYEFACGSWSKNYPSGANRSRFGTFDLVGDRVQNNTLTALLNLDISKQPEAVKKMKWAFDACMNTTEIDLAGLTPLQDVLTKSKDLIGSWPLITPGWTPNVQIEESIANLKRHYGIDSALTSFVFADENDTSLNALHIDQASLAFGVKTEDFYLGDSDLQKNVRQEYINLMVKVFKVLTNDLPDETLKQTADKVLEVETSIARLNSKPEDRRNMTRMYNKMTLAQLQTLGGGANFNFSTYIQALLQSPPPPTVVIIETTFIQTVTQLLSSTAKADFYNYIVWRLIYAQLPFSNSELRGWYATFATLLGKRGLSDSRNQTCLSYATGAPDGGSEYFGYAVGRVFVDEYFGGSAKDDIKKMVENIVDAMVEILTKLSWMDEPTRQEAIQKANTLKMYNNVGYPDFIKDNAQLDDYYTQLAITPADGYLDANLNVLRWMFQKEFGELGKAFNRQTFGGSPSIVNAWYSPQKNALTFPAGILQWPFFQSDFPKAVNYGNIGTVAGHEISHAFDDTGAQYDQNGNLRNWWSKDVFAQFEEKTQCIKDQYSQFYYDINGQRIYVNGNTTIGENLGDNGGIQEAYRAYQTWLNKEHDGVEEQRLPGLEHYTMNQIFYISFGNAWCGRISDEGLISQLLTNEHAPSRDRVIGTLQNFNAFAEAFNCPKSSSMNPQKKCVVWG